MKAGAWAATLLAVLVAADSNRAQGQPASSERELVVHYRKAIRAADAPTRAAAVTALGQASRELSDGGAGGLLARTLVRALSDEDMEVRAAALEEMSWGRHVEIAIEAFDELLKDLRGQIERRLTRPDEASQRYLQAAVPLYADCCEALSQHRDDRSVQALVEQIRTLTRRGGRSQPPCQHLLAPLTAALFELGSRPAAEAVIRQTAVYVGAGQRGCARRMHQEMAAWADGAGAAPPEFSDTWDQAWRHWFEEHADLFAPKLGKLAQPTGRPEERSRPGRRRRGPRPPSGPRRT